MKLFDTMPPFERFKRQFESHPKWPDIGSKLRLAALDTTKACCDRNCLPDKIDICFHPLTRSYPHSPGRVAHCVTWLWLLRPGCSIGMVTAASHEWDFTTWRKPSHGGPGRIGENVSEPGFSEGALDRFFGRMNRIREDEACAS